MVSFQLGSPLQFRYNAGGAQGKKAPSGGRVTIW